MLPLCHEAVVGPIKDEGSVVSFNEKECSGKEFAVTKDRSHRNHWYNRARELHAAAEALWRAETVSRSVYYMLCGLALEVIMKGIIASRGEAPPTKHDLNVLADHTKVKRNKEERLLLHFLTESVLWAGRYPIPKDADDKKLEDYSALARSVMEKPAAAGTMLIERSGATDWENFDELWRKYAAEFDHT